MKINPSPQQKIVADIFLLGLAILLLVLASGVETGRPLKPGVHSFFLGVYILYLGVLFLLSYFHADRSYVLSILMWVCEDLSRPRGRHMAFFYFILSFLLGTCAILAALGIF
jgi:hypothetical protein